jgi:tRNA(Ile)-lysidine synthase
MTVEEAGRTARYQAFLAENPDKIAVAHHQNDVAETMLFHLFRGTGIKGLASIAPIRDQIIRPLLCVSRNEIEQYLQEHKISYRIDATNALNDYSRKRIRNEMIPEACMINEKAVHHMCETAELLRETENYMTRMSEKAFANYIRIENNKKLVIDANLFEKEETIISMYVVRKCFQILSGKWKDITAVHLKKILELGRLQSGKQLDFPYGIHATKIYQTIHLQIENNVNLKEVPTLNIQIPSQGEILLPGGYLVKTEIIPYTKNSDIPKDTYTKCFDYDKIKHNIVIRTRQTGDYITINQSLGTQKLKTFYINNKIPLEKRNTIFLFAEGNHILWIVGYRISEEYKISDGTKRMWKVEIHHLQKENRNE